jgi:hypothetical protein
MSKPTYEELAAQVEVLRTQITKAREYLSHVDVNSAGVMLDVALESTPAACLAQVRADAGRAGYAECALDFGLCSTDEQRVNIVKQADAYAESIRQGGTS